MSKLETFNRALLDCQDLAYTLAYYLLGSEKEAAAALQSAVENTFRDRDGKTDSMHCLLLRRVLSACRELISGAKPQGDEFHRHLQILPFECRAVVVLVDVLGLDYCETARVMGRDQDHVRRDLSQARVGLRDIGTLSERRSS
jgi:DNA-directed RNA polymerase specialized sigma24 family protein